VAAGVEDEPAVLFYTLDPNTRTLEKLTDFDTNIAVNGVCMYHSARTGTYYVFATGTDGAVEQYALTAPDGELTLELARSFNVGSETDSCVADDEIGAFYISEEEVALWRYGAEPENGTSRRIVDHVNSWVGGSISEQVEGLTLLYGADRTGYLIAANEKATVFWCTNAPAKTS
jgi:3-phytase